MLTTEEREALRRQKEEAKEATRERQKEAKEEKERAKAKAAQEKMQRLKALGLDETVIKFFTKFIALKEEAGTATLDKELDALIQKDPKLLELSCPKDIDEECLTITEYVCQEEEGACPRDTLFELVEKGAVATDRCYELCLHFVGEFTHLLYYLVLMMSGYLPESFDLDGMVEDVDIRDGIDECENELNEIMSVLTRTAKVGDGFSCGKMTPQLVENLTKLPELKEGVTHTKGGPFERLMNKFLEDEKGKGKATQEKMERL